MINKLAGSVLLHRVPVPGVANIAVGPPSGQLVAALLAGALREAELPVEAQDIPWEALVAGTVGSAPETIGDAVGGAGDDALSPFVVGVLPSSTSKALLTLLGDKTSDATEDVERGAGLLLGQSIARFAEPA